MLPELEQSRLSPYVNHAIEWLDYYGIKPYTEKASDEIYEGLRNELARRPLENSFVAPNDSRYGDMQPGTFAFGIEIGGSNIYSKIAHAESRKNLKVLADTRSPFKGKTFDNFQHFFEYALDRTLTNLEALKNAEYRISALSVVYSFLGYPKLTDYGVDMQPDPAKLAAKGFEISDIHNIDEILIGEIIRNLLIEKYGIDIPRNIPIIVLNDTTKSMLTVPGAHMSSINGTGINIGFAQKGENGVYVIKNTESAEFASFPFSAVERINFHTNDKGSGHYAEMIAGGNSVGFNLNETVRRMYVDQFFPYQPNTILDGRHFTYILEHNYSELKKVFPGFTERDTDSFTILRGLAIRQQIRVAQVCGISQAAIVANHPLSFHDKRIISSWEGTNFEKTPGLVYETLRYFKRYAPDHILTLAPASGPAGALFAALRENNNR